MHCNVVSTRPCSPDHKEAAGSVGPALDRVIPFGTSFAMLARPQILPGGRCPKKEGFLRRRGAPLCRDPSLLAACASHSGRDLLSRCGRSGEFPSRPGDTPDSHRQNLLTRLLLCTVAQVVLLMLQCTVTVMPELSRRHTMCGSHVLDL